MKLKEKIEELNNQLMELEKERHSLYKRIVPLRKELGVCIIPLGKGKNPVAESKPRYNELVELEDLRQELLNKIKDIRQQQSRLILQMDIENGVYEDED